jgi:hypothetical protein
VLLRLGFHRKQTLFSRASAPSSPEVCDAIRSPCPRPMSRRTADMVPRQLWTTMAVQLGCAAPGQYTLLFITAELLDG